jgi:hypothetical protein
MSSFPDSMAGKNSYSFLCEEIKRPATYAICQHVIKAMIEKRLERGFEECIAKIKARKCPALRMIAQEKKAGKVLFWRDQPSVILANTPKVVKTEKPKNEMPKTFLRVRTSAPKEKEAISTVKIEAVNYGDVINKMIEKEKKDA